MSYFKNRIRHIIIIILGLFFYTILLTGVSRAVFSTPNDGRNLVGGFVSDLVIKSSDISKNMRLLLKKPDYLFYNNTDKDGFTYFTEDMSSYPKLLVSFKEGRFNTKVQLLDISSGEVVKEWIPDGKQISKLSYHEGQPKEFTKGADLNFGHPVFLKDSSIVFHTGFSLVKLNAKSEIEWVNNENMFHHSLEADEDGHIYATGSSAEALFHNYMLDSIPIHGKKLQENILIKVDGKTGKTLLAKSIIGLLEENGLQDLIYKNGYLTSDPIHLNDVQPALTDGDYWNKGDLLLSCRSLSIIFLYRPETNKIIWYKQGPWLSQHDPDFYGTKSIVVFGNDVIFNAPDSYVLKRGYHFTNSNSQVYVYNFEKDTTTTPFSRLFKNEAIKTHTQGRSEILPNGDIFIEETNSGKIIFGDSIKKKATFVRRIDKEFITALKWGRIVY
ncbi:MAG: arylsulfotransferase family protein [Flavobacteriaceae bacterium]